MRTDMRDVEYAIVERSRDVWQSCSTEHFKLEWDTPCLVSCILSEMTDLAVSSTPMVAA